MDLGVNGKRGLVLASSQGLWLGIAEASAAKAITVNVMLPGRIATAQTLPLDTAAAEKQAKTLEEVEAASRAGKPAKRYDEVEELGATAAFLCSDQAAYITGAAIRVDGGVNASV